MSVADLKIATTNAVHLRRGIHCGCPTDIGLSSEVRIQAEVLPDTNVHSKRIQSSCEFFFTQPHFNNIRLIIMIRFGSANFAREWGGQRASVFVSTHFSRHPAL